MQILEKNQSRLQALKEKTEEKLRDRLGKFDEKLKELYKRVEAFRNYGVRIELFLFFLHLLHYSFSEYFFRNLK